MKKLIATLTLMIAAQTANAALVTMDSMNQDGFVNAYSLDKFQIGEGSYTFQNADEIVAGSISIDKANNEMRLIVNRHFHCPAGQMCPMIMPAPIVVTLPVVYNGTQACGSVIVAERNNLGAHGDMLSIQVVDNTSCDRKNFPTMDLKPVSITVTEQAAPADAPIVSLMTGSAN